MAYFGQLLRLYKVRSEPRHNKTMITINDVYNQTQITPIALARLGILPRYKIDGVDHYDPADIQTGINRRYFSQPETTTMSPQATANHVGIPLTNLDAFAEQYGLKPNDAGEWNTPDVRQMYFANNYPQNTSSEDDASVSLGVQPQGLREFAAKYGYSPYTFVNGKRHYTALQLQEIKSKMGEMRLKQQREQYGWS